MGYRAVFFDFDYTLGDATQSIYAGFVYGLTEMGYPKPTVEEVRRTVGMQVPEAYALLTGDTRKEEGERFYSLFHPLARDLQAKGGVELFPGALELLRSLRERDVKVAIVSTKRATSLREILRNTGLEPYVELVIGGETVAVPKPSPEGIELALETFGVKREETLYCGDTVIDAETAQNAGVDFCAVLNGTTPATAFEDFPYKHIAPELSELRQWLELA